MSAIDDAIARHLARPAMSTEDPLTECACNDEFVVHQWLTDAERVEAEAVGATRLPEGFWIAGLFVVAVVSAIFLVVTKLP